MNQIVQYDGKSVWSEALTGFQTLTGLSWSIQGF